MSGRAQALSGFARGIGLATGALLVVAIALALVGAAKVLLLVFFALLLASALQPLVDWLRGRLPVRRGVAILMVYIVFFATVAGLGFLAVPLVVSQASQLVAQLPEVTTRIQTWSQGLQPPELASSIGALLEAAQDAVTAAPPQPGQLVSAGLSVADVVGSVVTVLALVFFWMTERQRMQRFTLSFLPLERRAGTREAWNVVETRLGGWVRGQLTLMLVLGIATGVAYTVMGLPSGPILGLIAGLAEILPLVGPALGVVPAILIAAVLRPDLLVVVVVAYVVIHLVESNVLVPFVMRNAVGVSPFLLLVSLLVGAALDGLLGALIAVPIVAAAEAILERLQDRAVPVAQDAASAAAAEPSEPSEPEESEGLVSEAA